MSNLDFIPLISVHLFSPFGHVFVSWIDDTSAFVSLKDKDWSNQVLNNFKSSDSVYRVRSYDEFLRCKDMNGTVTSQSCGITPTLEKTPFSLPPAKSTNGEAKKRHIAEEKATIKRHKSENEDGSPKKAFDEPEWE